MPRTGLTVNPAANAAARPAVLLTLAIGVAIGAGLPGLPVRVGEPVPPREAVAPIPVQPASDPGGRRSVRVIPLPRREADVRHAG